MLGCRREGLPNLGPLPEAPIETPTGPPVLINPLNLWEMMLEGSPSADAVGAIDGKPITTHQLDQLSGGAVTRIGDRVYDARDVAWKWLVERTALDRAAQKYKLDRAGLLRAAWAQVPAPTEADVDRMVAKLPPGEFAGEERRHAARSLLRMEKWAVVRSLLVKRGLEGLRFQRYSLLLIDPKFAPPSTEVAEVGERKLTRAELSQLAGFGEQLARLEYWHLARDRFDEMVGQLLLAREAQRLGTTTAELDKRARASAKDATPDEVEAFLREAPQYAADPQGRLSAREIIKRRHESALVQAEIARLRSQARVEFYLREPQFRPVVVRPVLPFVHGNRGTPALIALHGWGCDACRRGSELLFRIADAFKDRLHVEAGEYYVSHQLGSYRVALAARCADEQGKAWETELRVLAQKVTPTTAELMTLAGELGLDDKRFAACLNDEHPLPIILENLALADRLGLSRGIPGLFVHGVRLDDLADPGLVEQHVREAISQVEPPVQPWD